MIKKVKKNMSNFIFFITIILLMLLVFGTIIKVNAAGIIDNPYIDITFDTVAKENKNHGTLYIFNDNKTGIYGNNTIKYGIDENGTYMAWTSNYSHGGGFNLTVDKVIGEEYTIALKFSFKNTGEISGGWKKIIDFQKYGGFADSGLYFYDNGKIQFYPENSQGPQIKNNQVVDLLIRRNKNTKKFEVYNRVNNNSILCYEFTDSNGLSILSAGLGFFHDDNATSGENSPGGKVYSVKIWDSWIDVNDVWDLLDKEKEETINRYICKKIEGKNATKEYPGWKEYYECKDPENSSYKYFEDPTYKMEIIDIEKWKTEKGYIPIITKVPTNFDNPQTVDDVNLYIIVSTISLLVLVCIIYKKK